MADKDKKKLKVILKLPKSSSQLKPPATAAAAAAAVLNSSASALAAVGTFQFASTSDQRSKNEQFRQVAGTSSALLARIASPSSTLARFNASGSVLSAAATEGPRIPSLASSVAPAPPKKRKFKSVESSGAAEVGGTIVGATSAVGGDASEPSKGISKDGVKVQVDERTPAKIGGRGTGPGRTGLATAARASEASAQKRSHKKSVRPILQSDGRQVHTFGGVVFQPRPSPEPVTKPLLEGVVDKLQKKDTYGVFAEPVDVNQVPDYYDIIKDPMDFGTMRKKIRKGSYSTIESFEADINLICNNAMRYNGPETIYFKQAKAIRDLARKTLDGIRAQLSGDFRKTVPHKKRLLPAKRMHSKKPASTKAQLDGTIVDFGSGPTQICDGETQGWSKSIVDVVKAEKGPSTENLVGSNEFDGRGIASSGILASRAVTRDDASGSMLKSMGPRDGRRPLSTEEYHRNTYKQRLLPAHGQGPPLAAVGGELRQLVPMVNHDEHAYAQSLAQFGALLGKKAWCIIAGKLEGIQAAAATPLLTGSNSPVLAVMEKDLVTPRPPVARMENQSPVVLLSSGKYFGLDARRNSLSGPSQSSQSMAAISPASDLSHDMRGEAGCSCGAFYAGVPVSTSNAVSAGVVDDAPGNSSKLSIASPKQGLLELSKRERRLVESTSGSAVHSSGTKDLRAEESCLNMNEVESGGFGWNQATHSNQEVMGSRRGFLGASGIVVPLENDGDEQARVEGSGWTQNSLVNPWGSDDRGVLAKCGGKGSALDHGGVGAVVGSGGNCRHSDVRPSEEDMTSGSSGRTQPSTVNVQDHRNVPTLISSCMPVSTDGNLVASCESTRGSRLAWETCSSLASPDSGVSGAIPATVGKGFTPTWSTAALIHGPIPLIGRSEMKTQSWGQPPIMNVTHQAAVSKNLPPGIQGFHPQNSQLKLSSNLSSQMLPPSNVYGEYGNLVSRLGLHHGLDMLKSGVSITQSQELQSVDSLDMPVSSLQRVGSCPETHSSTRSAVLQQGSLQLQSMPPDLNVALLSPSALSSSPAQEGSNPSSTHQPDLKLQL